MLEWLTRLIRRVLPRVIPVDPETGGTMLLFTLRPFGFLGDNSDATALLAERTDPQPGPTQLWLAGEVLETGAFPATISHVILYVRARTADLLYNGSPLYSDTKIVYGSQLDEDGGVPDHSAAVQAFPEFSYATRSVTLPLAPDGLPWTYDKVQRLVIGVSVIHTAPEFGIEGYLELADVWVEAYGTQDEPIRRSKFKPGTYSMTFNDTTYVVSATSDEVRSLYEAASSAKVGGARMPVSFRAVTLDNGTITTPNPPAVNSTPAQLLAAIAAYADPVSETKPL